MVTGKANQTSEQLPGPEVAGVTAEYSCIMGKQGIMGTSYRYASCAHNSNWIVTKDKQVTISYVTIWYKYSRTIGEVIWGSQLVVAKWIAHTIMTEEIQSRVIKLGQSGQVFMERTEFNMGEGQQEIYWLKFNVRKQNKTKAWNSWWEVKSPLCGPKFIFWRAALSWVPSKTRLICHRITFSSVSLRSYFSLLTR